MFEIEVSREGDLRRDLANLVVSNGWGLLELRRLKVSLEDIFLELTTQDEAAAAVSDETDQPTEAPGPTSEVPLEDSETTHE